MLYLRSSVDKSGRIYGYLTSKYIESRLGEYCEYNKALTTDAIYINLWRWLNYKSLMPCEDEWYYILGSHDVCGSYIDFVDNPEYLIRKILEMDRDTIIDSDLQNLVLDSCNIHEVTEAFIHLWKNPKQQEALKKKYPRQNHLNEILGGLQNLTLPDQLDILCDFLSEHPNYTRDIWKINPRYQHWFDILSLKEIRSTGFAESLLEELYWKSENSMIKLLLSERFRRGSELDRISDRYVYLRMELGKQRGIQKLSYSSMIKEISKVYTTYSTQKLILTDYILQR